MKIVLSTQNTSICIKIKMVYKNMPARGIQVLGHAVKALVRWEQHHDLVQDCGISSASALEIPQYYT